MKTLPSQEYIKQFLSYNSETGKFTNLFRPATTKGNKYFNSAFAGKIAGFSQGKSQYIAVNVNQEPYLAHRLAWVYHYGVDPGDNQIDHINQDRTDNRIVNLRLATGSQNMANSPRYKTYKGQPVKRPHKGIQAKPNGKFTARIGHENAGHYLGTFDTLAEAIKAREEAADELHKEFKHV